MYAILEGEANVDHAASRATEKAFREKYGWVDAWYGLLLRRHAVPVRLGRADD